MRNYKISETGLREERFEIGVVKPGFNVVKVNSVSQALLATCNYYEAQNFEDALKEAGITCYSKLDENEIYYGYIAVWNGVQVRTFFMEGSMRASTKNDGIGCLDYHKKELIQSGRLITGCYNVFGGNLPIVNDKRHNAFPGLANRLANAIRSGNFEIQLNDEEKSHLDQWPCFKNAIRLIN